MKKVKVYEFALIGIIGLSEAILPGRADATAIMNILYDQFELDAYTIWGVNNEGPPPEGIDIGTVEAKSLSGSVFSGNALISRVGTHTNMTWAGSSLYSFRGNEWMGVILGTIFDFDPAGSGPGFGFARAEWNLVFNIEGDGAHFGGSSGTPYGICELSLYDLTTWDLYQGYIADVELTSGHTYRLSAIVLQNKPFDEGVDIGIGFGGAVARVSESSALGLLSACLLGLGFARRRRGPVFPL